MKISKNSKKLMSIIMMMAFVFSSLVATQKPAKAAEEAPIVQLVGATLREDDGSGKQALRFAIRIENADKANDCGITIRANKKEETISVKTGQEKIYKKNGNTIIYTAAVTGIPASYAKGEFQFLGFVTPIDGAKKTTDPVSKNLTDVADAAGYQIEVVDDAIVATAKGGDLANKANGNAGEISLNDENLAGKKVEISFEMRVQGAITDGVTMDFQTNYGGDSNPNNPKWTNNTIYNDWTQFSFQWVMPKKDKYLPVLYLTKSEGSTYDAEKMNFYYQNFSVSVVDENAVEGTAVNVFSDSEGKNEGFTTFADPALNYKTVAQLTTDNFDNPGIIVKFKLPNGKTLEDYNTLSLRINSNGAGNKQMGIDWRDNANIQTSYNANGAYTIYSSGQNHYISNGNEWKTETFTLNFTDELKTLQSEKGQTVYLGIYYRADGNSTIKFTDIILTKSN